MFTIKISQGPSPHPTSGSRPGVSQQRGHPQSVKAGDQNLVSDDASDGSRQPNRAVGTSSGKPVRLRKMTNGQWRRIDQGKFAHCADGGTQVELKVE